MNQYLSDKQDDLEASVFAMELLMPLRFLKNDLKPGENITSKRLTELSKRYGVDESIMTYRLISLNKRKDISVVFSY